MNLFLDGEETDYIKRSDLPEVATVEALVSQQFNYVIEVTDDLELDELADSSEDGVSNSRGTGSVDGDTDSYRFTGTVVKFSDSERVDVTVTQDAVVVSGKELGPSDGTSYLVQVKNGQIYDSSRQFNPSTTTVGGTLYPGESVEYSKS